MMSSLITLIPALLFLGGFCTNTMPILVYWLKDQQSLSMVQATLLQSIYFSGYFVMGLPCAYLISRFGHKFVLLFSCILASISALAGLALPLDASVYLYYPLIFLLACAVTCLRISALPYLATLKEDPAYSGTMNFFLAFDTLGAIVAPSITTALLYHLPPNALLGSVPSLRAYFCFLIMSFSLAFWLIQFFLAPSPYTHKDPFSLQELTLVLQSTSICRGFLSLFLFVGVEFTAVHYLVTILSANKSFSETTTAFCIGIYWAQMLFGRLMAGFFRNTLWSQHQLTLPLVLAIVLCVIAAPLPVAWACYPILLLGLSNATLYPTIYSTFSKDTPLHQQHYVSSIFLTATCGGAFLPYLLSLIMAANYTRYPLIVVVAAYSILFYLGYKEKQVAVQYTPQEAV